MESASAHRIELALRHKIQTGSWEAGRQLPAERVLAGEFGAARNTVRRALAALEEAGYISRHVGRGTFVNAIASPRGDGLIARLRDASPADVMEMRLIIEPQVAALAATRASGADLEAIETSLRNSLAAKGIAEFEHWDGKFHLAVVAASKNALLADHCHAINEVRNQPRWYQLKKRSLTPERRVAYDKQHSAIVTALRERDAERAAQTMRAHLLDVQRSMTEFER
jgi:DNA-binding FadR family transcriptional regulator